MAEHAYKASIVWTGNQGEGTTTYRAYTRDYDIAADGKPVIKGSADPSYMGDASRYNPEDMLVASVSACHMLWYLHLCAVKGVVIQSYEDHAEGRMAVQKDGAGEFSEIVLRPQITISAGDRSIAEAMHEKAHEMCFIARSVNFPVRCEPEITVSS